MAPAAIAAASVAAIAWQPRTPYVRGSAEAADHIVDGTPHRVLYCGSVGVPSFIFSVRSLDPQLRTSVIRASSVAPKLSVREIEELAHRYAIDSIVVTEPRPDRVCDALKAGVPSTMVLKAEVPMTSSVPSSTGTFKIYRFTDPSPTPEKRLKIRLPRLRRDVFLHLQ